MSDNPYPNASDTMHYELHTAWDYSPGYYPTHQVVQEGWRCPVCKTVHAPFMPTCTRCSPAVVTRVANVTTADTPTPEDTDGD